jgi:hypothetical protein
MSFRFRAKVGPFIYDEKLGEGRDPRPSLLTPGDLVVIALAGVLLIGAVVMALVTS